MSLDQATPDQWMAGASAVERDWDALYADQLPRIYNYFRFRVGTDADAEDLTAHTFERAWRARERYRQDYGPDSAIVAPSSPDFREIVREMMTP